MTGLNIGGLLVCRDALDLIKFRANVSVQRNYCGIKPNFKWMRTVLLTQYLHSKL